MPLLRLERVDIGSRSRLDEFLVEFLPTEFVLRNPLRPRLCVLSQPRYEDRGETADGGPAGAARAVITDAFMMPS
jgi:hypothetical protein